MWPAFYFDGSPSRRFALTGELPPVYPFESMGACNPPYLLPTRAVFKSKKAGILSDTGLLFLMAPRVGLEPTTLRLTVACSTIELPRNALETRVF